MKNHLWFNISLSIFLTILLTSEDAVTRVVRGIHTIGAQILNYFKPATVAKTMRKVSGFFILYGMGDTFLFNQIFNKQPF